MEDKRVVEDIIETVGNEKKYFEGLKESEMEMDLLKEKLLDQSEVAEILNVSVKTLEYWRWKKIGPEYVKVGRLARYRESAIRKFIEQLTN